MRISELSRWEPLRDSKLVRSGEEVVQCVVRRRPALMFRAVHMFLESEDHRMDITNQMTLGGPRDLSPSSAGTTEQSTLAQYFFRFSRLWSSLKTKTKIIHDITYQSKFHLHKKGSEYVCEHVDLHVYRASGDGQRFRTPRIYSSASITCFLPAVRAAAWTLL